MSELVRLNKVIADAGICSRRKADELIFNGQVLVNGELETNPGRKIDKQSESVEVSGQKLKLSSRLEPCYLLLNKPTQVMSTVSDPEGRPTVMEYIPNAFKSRRLYPVGRLDYFSEGLLLLTDDGELANLLMHPRYNQDRVYRVLVREEVEDYMVSAMQSGMTLSEGEKLAPVKVRIVTNAHYRGTLLELTLTQGINRQIRRMCRDLNLTILQLKRIAHGSINIMGLESGEARLLSPLEVQELKKNN